MMQIFDQNSQNIQVKVLQIQKIVLQNRLQSQKMAKLEIAQLEI